MITKKKLKTKLDYEIRTFGLCVLLLVVFTALFVNPQITEINNENTELQNKLDSLKSFSNVDKTFQQNNMLKRAGQVIETPAIAPEPAEIVVKKSMKKKVFKHAIGF